MNKEENVYKILNELGIEFTKFEHKPVYTVQDINELNLSIPGMGLKNLFLRNKKGDEHYLVIVEDNKRINLKALSLQLKTTGLTFASKERLDKYLGLQAGAVTVFGLINDNENNVKVILDKDIIQAKKVGFHPNVNTSTIVIEYIDLKKYLEWTKNEVLFIEI